MRRFLYGVIVGVVLTGTGVYRLGPEGVTQVGLRWQAASMEYQWDAAPTVMQLELDNVVLPEPPKVAKVKR